MNTHVTCPAWLPGCLALHGRQHARSAGGSGWLCMSSCPPPSLGLKCQQTKHGSHVVMQW